MALTPQEINNRLTELRNLRKLYAGAKNRIVILETENKALKLQVKELKAENQQLRSDVTDIKYQLTELRTMVFKKNRQVTDIQGDDSDDDTPPKPPRTKESYQRPIPKDSEVTKTIHHQLCWAHLIRHFRDLASHPSFEETVRSRLLATYQEIKAIYQDTKSACAGPDPGSERQTLIERLTTVATITLADQYRYSELRQPSGAISTSILPVCCFPLRL